MMWVIIDGNNWFSRAWFALKPTTSTDPEIIQFDIEERSSRAVRTVLDWVVDSKQQLQPTTLAICWDSPNSLRKKMFPGYKSERSKPEGFHAAMQVLRGRLEDYWNVELDGYEADDLLAKFAHDAAREGERCLLCSSDKDLHQCLKDGVVSQCVNMTRLPGNHKRRFDFEVLTAKGLVERYGVDPSQWVDFRCIVGDKTDGLAGASGIGPASARDILGTCLTLDEFYANPLKAPITPSKRNAMFGFKSQVSLMRRLVTLPLNPNS